MARLALLLAATAQLAARVNPQGSAFALDRGPCVGMNCPPEPEPLPEPEPEPFREVQERDAFAPNERENADGSDAGGDAHHRDI